MRTFWLLILLTVVLSCATAGDRPDVAGDEPDWGYPYQNPHYLPDNPPAALAKFHDAFVPMYEARHSRESAYIRENAAGLYEAARSVPGSLKTASSPGRLKHYNRAAKDLVRSCRRLKEIVHGGANAEVYDQMHQIERDYLRVANLCD